MEKKTTGKLKEHEHCIRTQVFINDMQNEINKSQNNIVSNFQMRIKRLEELVECNMKDIDEMQGDMCSGTDEGFNGYRPRFKI